MIADDNHNGNYGIDSCGHYLSQVFPVDWLSIACYIIKKYDDDMILSYL